MKSATTSKNGKSQTRKSSSASAASVHSSGLMDLFEDQLKDIYWAEKALTKAIPKMIKKASTEELSNALQEHLEVTQGQVEKVEEVFGILGKPARAKKCEAMEGLIKEAEGLMEETEEGVVRDAAIIAAAQKIEHYEIATYGTLCAFASALAMDDAAGILEEIMNEEKDADTTLSEIAESTINSEAAEEDSDEEEEEE